MNVREQPSRKDGDVVAVLVVTAGAQPAVWDRLRGVALVTSIPRPEGQPPRFLLEARRNGEPEGTPARARYGMTLTARELEVLQHVAAGLQNAEIAAELFLSVETVRTHVKNMLRKLGAVDRAHAVHIGHSRGWLRPEAKDGAA